MPYEEDKLLHEPVVERKKLGRVIHKAGEWYNDKTQCSPHDIIEGYVLESQFNTMEETNEYLRNENKKYYNEIVRLKEGNSAVLEEENQDHLNLMYDIKRIEKVIRRLDKRSRISKDTDVTVRCANAIGLLEGKKLLLIQAVTHVKRK